MLAAVEFADAGDARRAQQRALALGVYVLAKGPNVLIAPPLVIGAAELEEGIHVLDRVLHE